MAAKRNILQRKATKRDNEAVGGLSCPSKMPGYAYGISAKECALGSTLAKRPGSVCYGCYALKNNYTYPSVIKAHAKRLAAMQDYGKWMLNMSTLLEQLGTMLPDEERYFRWHDSGDLQGIAHLHAIAYVAIRNPEWHFWLPTREYGIVRKYRELHDIPSNLTVRLSAIWVGKEAPGNDGLPTSTVSSDKGFRCPAPDNKNSCGTCRACWDPQVANVDYKKH